MKLAIFSWQIFYLLINVKTCLSSTYVVDKTVKQRRGVDGETNRGNLSCQQPGQTPYSFSVTSVRISGHKVNRTDPPPYGYTEEMWGMWDYNYSVTAEVTYTVTHPSHCTQDPLERYNCNWPNTVPNVAWYLSSLGDNNFTQTSVSTRQPNGQYSTTLTATDPAVIPHVAVKMSLQSDDLAFRFDKGFQQHHFHDNSWERSYPSVTFHCYPPKTVRAVVGQDLNLSWSFTIKPAPGETKGHLLNHTLRFNGRMLDRPSLNRPPSLYYNKLRWSAKLSDLSKEGTRIDISGTGSHPWSSQPGKFLGELEELDDGYTVNLQFHFPADLVDHWMKGMLRLNFGGIVSVTHLGVDDAEVNNRTTQYFLQHSCPFDMDTLNVAIKYGWFFQNDVSFERYIEVRLGDDLPNNAIPLVCQAFGCNIDKLELRRNGQPVNSYFQPDQSDNILQQGYGAFKEIYWFLTHVSEDTLGTYECFASDTQIDKSGNSTSRKIALIAKRLVKAKLLEWTENYAIVACRGSGIPLPSLSFVEKESDWQLSGKEMPPFEYSQVNVETLWAKKSWFNDEPSGRLVQAVVNITAPVDSLKGKTIVCKSNDVYGDKTAEVKLSWGYPKKPRTWDRA